MACNAEQRVLIVGAGLSGSVLARCLADAGVRSLVIDRRDHVAGLCHSSRDETTGIEVHRFGPHTFHTSDERVWAFVQRFDRWYQYEAKAMASNARGVFSLPINLHTINQLFGRHLTPEQARAFIARLQDTSIATPRNAEEQLLRFVGREIYETFFRDYTIKQWGVSPRELAPDIVKRIPVRFHYSSNYFFDRRQGYPMSGYTAWISAMLDHPNIEVRLNTPFEHGMQNAFRHTFYCGALDAWFRHAHGPLSYRTLDFRYEYGTGDLQGCSWMNYTDMSAPYTRTHEHKYFSPWETHEKSVLVYEYSREAGAQDDPFYPKRLAADLERLRKYTEMASQTRGVTFMGRLGCYRYLDMHQVTAQAMDTAEAWLSSRNGTPPLWSAPPL